MAAAAYPPGGVLARRFEAVDVFPAELARHLAVPANRIINRKRGITGDSELRFAHWVGDASR